MTELTTGKLIDKLFELREEKKRLNAKIKDIESEVDQLKNDLFQRLDKEESTVGRGQLASCSVTETTVPAVEDWDQVHGWIAENDGLYLLQRRLNSAPFRELLAQGVDIPGISPMPIRDISIRKISPR